MTKEQKDRLEQIRYDLDMGVTSYLCLEAANNLYDELNWLESLESEKKENTL